MNKVNIFFILVVFAFLSGAAWAGNWYEGGTLHKSNVPTWKSAAYKNKLATASDWALTSPSVKTVVQNSGDINTAKKFAAELISCIDTATEGIELDGSTAAVAASCMVLMGWLK